MWYLCGTCVGTCVVLVWYLCVVLVVHIIWDTSTDWNIETFATLVLCLFGTVVLFFLVSSDPLFSEFVGGLSLDTTLSGAPKGLVHKGQVRDVGNYDTCWWYSWCNLEYCSKYTNTCSYNSGCCIYTSNFFHILMFDLHDHYDPFSYFFNVRLTRYNKLFLLFGLGRTLIRMVVFFFLFSCQFTSPPVVVEWKIDIGIFKSLSKR